MARFILRRILLLIPVIAGLTLLVFAIARILPGDPARAAAGPNATEAEVAALSREFALDQPLAIQYWRYLTGLARGDWGSSIFTRRPVLDDLLTFLPATLELVIVAMILAIAIGAPVGLASAIYADRWPDFAARVVALAGISMPRFFLGLLLQLLFASWMGWLPLSGRFPLVETPPERITGFYILDSLLAGDLHALWTTLTHLALPALATCLSPLATIMRTMRATTIEVLQQDYVLMEQALGLSQRKIHFKYVLKNALTATMTTIGLYFGWLLGGTVLVETVFDWPGIGLYATNALLTQDFMPVIGVTIVIGLMFVAMNFAVDVAYGFLNPKVRYS